MKQILLSLFIAFTFLACTHKNIDGSSNFQSLMQNAVSKASSKIKKNINEQDVVLVSDFVNLDRLKNKSKLGFLLSNLLKDSLSSLDIIIREVEFAKNFELGQSGLNLLTRNADRILSKKSSERFAVVGTYSITTERLNIFIRLIELETGNILASAYESTEIDKEVLELEGLLPKKKEETPRYLAPRMVL